MKGEEALCHAGKVQVMGPGTMNVTPMLTLPAKADTVTFTLTLCWLRCRVQAPPLWIPGQASPPRASQMQSVPFLRPRGPLLAIDSCYLAGRGHSELLPFLLSGLSPRGQPLIDLSLCLPGPACPFFSVVAVHWGEGVNQPFSLSDS